VLFGDDDGGVGGGEPCAATWHNEEQRSATNVRSCHINNKNDDGKLTNPPSGPVPVARPRGPAASAEQMDRRTGR
jgi:hypothetical protein